jgi:hypothetical protein
VTKKHTRDSDWPVKQGFSNEMYRRLNFLVVFAILEFFDFDLRRTLKEDVNSEQKEHFTS